MKKLQSMTDFVLDEQRFKEVSDTAIFKVTNYANFLKQPLMLGMFIPCDESGNVLRKPIDISEFHPRDWDVMNIEHSEYNKAKRKVLFKGVEKFQVPQGKEIYTLNNLPILLPDVNGKYNLAFGLNTIEDLCKYEVELTESAIKQFM